MDKDSIPDEQQGVDETQHSPTDDSADTTEVTQTSNEEDNDLFGNDESEETSDDTPSQTAQESSDDTQVDNSTDGVDPELVNWAKSQNISLTTETEVKLAKRLRDTQTKMHQATSDSKKKFAEAVNDSTDDTQARLEAKMARYDFFESHPDARALEGEMFDIALAARDAGDEAGFKYYQTPRGWETLYKIAKAEKLEQEGDSSFNAGREAERKNLAKKQQAAKTQANAQPTNPESTKITDEKIANMSVAEYTKFRKENPDWNPFFGS